MAGDGGEGCPARFRCHERRVQAMSALRRIRTVQRRGGRRTTLMRLRHAVCFWQEVSVHADPHGRGASSGPLGVPRGGGPRRIEAQARETPGAELWRCTWMKILTMKTRMGSTAQTATTRPSALNAADLAMHARRSTRTAMAATSAQNAPARANVPIADPWTQRSAPSSCGSLTPTASLGPSVS